jgi:hypothetical protein
MICHYAGCRYAEYRVFLLLCWILSCWVSLDWMSLCRVSWPRYKWARYGCGIWYFLHLVFVQKTSSFDKRLKILCLKNEYDQSMLKYFIRLFTSYNWSFIVQRAWLLYPTTSHNYFITCCNPITHCFIIKHFFFSRYRKCFHYWRNLSGNFF